MQDGKFLARVLPLLLIAVSLAGCRTGIEGCGRSSTDSGGGSPANQASIVANLRSIHSGQSAFLERHDHYACTMTELGSQFGLIDRQLSYGRKDGYNYSIDCSPGNGAPGYQVWAMPVDSGFTGSSAYCTDQTGAVHSASNRLDTCAEAHPLP